jgi:serine/threonine protein kinase
MRCIASRWRVRRICIVFAARPFEYRCWRNAHELLHIVHGVMHELSTQLGNFIGGAINLDQLRAVFRTYIAQHQDQRETVSRWLRDTVEEGRLSATVWLSLRDLFDPPSPSMAATSAFVKPAAQGVSGSQQGTQLASPRAAAAAPEHVKDRIEKSRPNVPLFEPEIRPSCDTMRTGVVVKDRFVLVEQLGSGGMGQVFKARDLRREEAHDRHPFIALKVLNKEVSARPDSFMALQREARRAGTLAHPNVVTVYDFDRDGTRIYMTMEYLEGRGLDDFLREECGKGLPLSKAWPIIHGIALALEYGHQKRIVHSDLKPGNIFVCKDGTVKVLDFGIARLINPTGMATEETLFDPVVALRGLTPAYAALEMWNREAPDPRDDIYALACVTYELLSGNHPFNRLSAKAAVERNLAPPRIVSLTRAQWDGLKKGLALRRENRSPTVASFIAPFAPRSRLHRYAVPATVTAVLATAATLTVSARFYRDAVEDSTLQVLQCAQIPKPAALASSESTTPPTPEQQQSIDDYLVLAQDSLSGVTATTGIDDLKYILSDGPNSVNELLDAVLRIDPAHREALKLKADAANFYAARAQSLLGQQHTTEALDLVRYGRQVLPGSQELFRLEQEVCRKQALATTQN